MRYVPNDTYLLRPHLVSILGQIIVGFVAVRLFEGSFFRPPFPRLISHLRFPSFILHLPYPSLHFLHFPDPLISFPTSVLISYSPPSLFLSIKRRRRRKGERRKESTFRSRVLLRRKIHLPMPLYLSAFLYLYFLYTWRARRS